MMKIKKISKFAIILVVGIAIVFAFFAIRKSQTALPKKTPIHNNSAADINPAPNESLTDNESDRKNTMMLSFMVEGELEEVPATLFIGEGYSIYIPDDGWQMFASDGWSSTENDLVQFWITHFKEKSMRQVEAQLTTDGYHTVESDSLLMEKLETERGILRKVMVREYKDSTWGVFYCYPIEAEEGWGARLPTIVQSFAISSNNISHTK